MPLSIPFPSWLTELDMAFSNFIQQHCTNPFFDKFFTFVTHLGDEGYIWIALAIFFFLFKKTRKIGIVIGISLILGTLLGNMTVKEIFERPRPFATPGAILDGDALLIPRPGQFSFPSGHTVSSFAAAFSVFIYNKKWSIPVFVLAALVAFSRVYIYVHFLTDILAGALVGLISAYLAYLLWTKCLDKLVVCVWNKIFKKHSIDHV